MNVFVVLAIGIVLGASVMCIIHQFTKDVECGTIIADLTDPDGPYFFLEMNTDPYRMCNEKYVTFKVKVRGPQK